LEYEQDFQLWIEHHITLLKQGRCLKSKMSAAVTKIYPKAVAFAVKETQLPQKYFPAECPYTIEQLLDDDFYPESQ
jgi:hypothetical protein